MKNKIALITGGSTGIGFAFAEILAQQGYQVILISRNQERLDAAVKKIQHLGYTAYGYRADVSCYDDMKKIFEDIKTHHVKIDFLILNAGIISLGTLQQISADDIRNDILINLFGAILTAKLFTELLPDSAKILIVSSTLGMIGLAGYSSYCATKSGLINFGQVLRRELLSRKINVYIACPADVITPLYQKEIENTPAWMRSSNRPKPISAELAAAKILGKCHGKKQLILINKEILLFYFLEKFLPTRFINFVLDKMFPIPLKTN